MEELFEFISNNGRGAALSRRIKKCRVTFYEVIINIAYKKYFTKLTK